MNWSQMNLPGMLARVLTWFPIIHLKKIGYKIPQRREINTQKTPTSRTGLFLPQDTQMFGAKGLLISTKATSLWIHQPASSKPYSS